MKVKKAILTAMSAVLFLSACSADTIYSNHSEANEIELVRTVGIDRDEGGVTVTATTGVGLDESPPKVVYQQGATVAEALKALSQNPTGREVTFSHIENFLIGEASSSEIDSCLDYLARDVEVRLTTNIYIVRGGTAKDLITGTMSGQDDVTEMLTTLKRDIVRTGEGYVYNSRDVLANIDRIGCSLMMAVKAEKNADLSDGASELMVVPDGFAVVDGKRSVGTLDVETAHAVVVLVGRFESETMAVDDGNGAKVTALLTVDKMKIRPIYENSSLKGADITVAFKAKVVGIDGAADISEAEALRRIEKEISLRQAERFADAVKALREMNRDFADIGWRLNMADPAEYRKTGEEDWKNRLDSMEFRIKTSAEIDRSYELETLLE